MKRQKLRREVPMLIMHRLHIVFGPLEVCGPSSTADRSSVCVRCGCMISSGDRIEPVRWAKDRAKITWFQHVTCLDPHHVSRMLRENALITVMGYVAMRQRCNRCNVRVAVHQVMLHSIEGLRVGYWCQECVEQ